MTRAQIAIGIDAGTSGCKAIAMDGRGRVVATTEATYPTRRRPDGEVTQDARDWLSAVKRATSELIMGVDARAVETVGLTAPAHYAVTLDGSGDPIHRVLLASDGRPDDLARAMARDFGPSFIETTGNALSAGWSLPQLAWLARQDPSRWLDVAHVAVIKDFIRFRMTGVLATDPSDAIGTAMASRHRLDWDDDLVGAAGLDRAQLPPICPSVSVGGALTPEWAKAVGLRSGIPVAVGATDTAAELVSLGAMRPGTSVAKIASTGTIVSVGDRAQPDPRLLTYPHAVHGRWYSLAATNTAATAYTWLRETVFERAPAGPRSVYAEMDHLATRVPPGADGALFLPFLEGERTPYWNTAMRGGFTGLSSGHRPAHLCRAVLEGVAFSLRDCRDVFTSTNRHVIDPILSGGGVASRLWRQILVAVLGGTGRLAEPQGPALGAALLACAAIGLPPSADGQATGRPAYRTVTAPRGWVEAYDRLYPRYLDAARAAADRATPV